MGLEDIFQQSAEEWTNHCRKNWHHSDIESYLNCDAYRKIISLGPQILPLIRNQLNKEYETATKYENALKRIKQKVFGDENIFLYGETYYKICEDEEYKEYSKGYHKDVLGKPGFRWGYAVSEIISDFGLPVGKEGSGAALETVGSDFVKMNVHEVQRETIEWLDKNMHKYLPTNTR